MSMSRKNRVETMLNRLQEKGVISEWYIYAPAGRSRYVFTPAGHSERALLISEVEDFILGANAAQTAVRRAL